MNFSSHPPTQYELMSSLSTNLCNAYCVQEEGMPLLASTGIKVCEALETVFCLLETKSK